MDLDVFSDSDLINRIEKLVREEREILTSVLHVLKEIDKRRLFSSMGYKSLFDFANKRLGYSEDQAYRRIAAIRLMRELPEIETKITAGEINLSHISVAQSLFSGEKKLTKELSRDQKLMVFENISGKSAREAERIALELSSSPENIKPDRVKLTSAETIEIRFSARKEVVEKIERLKGYLAHKHPDVSIGELFERLCDLGLETFNPAKEKSATFRKRCVIKPNSQAQTHREVFQKAQNRCENCGSTYALEIDHIVPRAKGGGSIAENLRLLCRSCNQRSAIKEFGQNKMDKYINS